MDASKLTQMRMQAANTYRSNWQGRDASEVTTRKYQMAQSANKSTHRGPEADCCTGGVPNTSKRSSSPTNGFSTNFSQSIVSEKTAGCAQCNDPNFGSSGGVVLQNCSTIATILAVPLNPVKGSQCPCADPGVPFHQVYPPKPIPSYTGWYNQVPANPELCNGLRAPQFSSS
jgi:hypothetical protein